MNIDAFDGMYTSILLNVMWMTWDCGQNAVAGVLFWTPGALRVTSILPVPGG